MFLKVGHMVKSHTLKDGTKGMLDTSTNLFWYDEELNEYTYDQAMEKFNTPYKRLPTKEEFEQIESYYKELNFKDNWYWSASLYSSTRSLAWFFFGNSGYVYSAFRSNTYSVRCVVNIKDIYTFEFNSKLEELIND